MKKFAQSMTGCAAACLLLLAGAASAATLSQAQRQYQQERAACMSGSSNQERATCLKEAGAALQEARRGNLSARQERYLGQNRVERCAALPVQDRDDCVMRMRQGSTSGSAQQGGILRELASPVPARATQSQ